MKTRGEIEGKLQDSRRGQLARVSGMNLCSQPRIIEADKSTQLGKCKGLAIWDVQVTEKICALVSHMQTRETPFWSSMMKMSFLFFLKRGFAEC